MSSCGRSLKWDLYWHVVMWQVTKMGFVSRCRRVHVTKMGFVSTCWRRRFDSLVTWCPHFVMLYSVHSGRIWSMLGQTLHNNYDNDNKQFNNCFIGDKNETHIYFFSDLYGKLRASGVLSVTQNTLWWRQNEAREKSAQRGAGLVKRVRDGVKTNKQKSSYKIDIKPTTRFVAKRLLWIYSFKLLQTACERFRLAKTFL